MAAPDYDSFTTDTSIQDGHIVNTSINGRTSSLDLNTILGNVNGVFSIGGTNFSQGAENVKITDGFQLEADLPDSNGNLAHAVTWIGSLVAADGSLQHYVGAPHSTAHAEANDNEQANAALASQAQTQSESSSITSVQTIHGDASQYWPDGNAPAAGHHVSKPARMAIGIACLFVELLRL